MSCPGVLPDRTMLEQSKRYATKAAALDPLDSLAQLCRAWASCLLGEHDQALSGFDLALTCNENDPWTEISAALGKMFCGDAKAAGKLAARSAIKIWARTPVYWTYQCTIRYLQNDYANAVRAAENSDNVIINVHGWHAAALWNLSRKQEAITAWDRLTRRTTIAWAAEEPANQSAICAWFCEGFPIRNRSERLALERTISEISEAYSKALQSNAGSS